jgi:hypothetical protein
MISWIVYYQGQLVFYHWVNPTVVGMSWCSKVRTWYIFYLNVGCSLHRNCVFAMGRRLSCIALFFRLSLPPFVHLSVTSFQKWTFYPLYYIHHLVDSSNELFFLHLTDLYMVSFLRILTSLTNSMIYGLLSQDPNHGQVSWVKKNS